MANSGEGVLVTVLDDDYHFRQVGYSTLLNSTFENTLALRIHFLESMALPSYFLIAPPTTREPELPSLPSTFPSVPSKLHALRCAFLTAPPATLTLEFKPEAPYKCLSSAFQVYTREDKWATRELDGFR